MIVTSRLRQGVSAPADPAHEADPAEQANLRRIPWNGAALLQNLVPHVPGMLYQYHLSVEGVASFPYVSEGVKGILELTPEQVRGDHDLARTRIHPDDYPLLMEAIQHSAHTLEPWERQFRVRLPMRGERWLRGRSLPTRLPDGSTLWHGHLQDITDSKVLKDRTERFNFHDALTDLPNRARLMHVLGAVAVAMDAGAGHSGGYGALLRLNLDRFKHINMARGRDIGDALLVQVAERLRAMADYPGHALARLGGDEFAVLLTDLGGDRAAAVAAAQAFAEEVRAHLQASFMVDDDLYQLTGSIGATLFPKRDGSMGDLLREADVAVHRAKRAGRNRVAFFEESMLSMLQERLALEQGLKDALARGGQFSLCIQPQVDARGVETGGEALLRWHHPEFGEVPPAKFIPIAEECGLIGTLGDWMLQRACETLARMAGGGSRATLSVNISPRQFCLDSFVDDVRAVLARTGAPPDRLILEVTEGLFIDCVEEVAARMQVLRELGIRFSIDDFGTGYSSLAYLRKLPLHELKIDKSFVQDMLHDADGAAIVQSILGVARNLHLHVVAEGVESCEQAEMLAASGCTSFQGFHYSRPLGVEEWLARTMPA